MMAHVLIILQNILALNGNRCLTPLRHIVHGSKQRPIACLKSLLSRGWYDRERDLISVFIPIIL